MQDETRLLPTRSFIRAVYSANYTNCLKVDFGVIDATFWNMILSVGWLGPSMPDTVNIAWVSNARNAQSAVMNYCLPPTYPHTRHNLGSFLPNLSCTTALCPMNT